MSENQDLRDKNDMMGMKVNKYSEIENEILRFYSDQFPQFKQGDLTQMVQKLVNDNLNFKENL